MKKLLFFSLCTALTALAFAGPGHAHIGDNAPNFTLSDSEGNQVSLSDFKDKTVVLEWINPDCPFVKRHYKAGTMKKLAAKYDDVVWLAINSTKYADHDHNNEWIEKHTLSYTILDDSEGQVGRAYAAQTTPHMFIIHEGTLVYAGAIDDDPNGNKDEPVNFVDQALAEIQAGKAVSNSKTKPYGCSVKYKSRS